MKSEQKRELRKTVRERAADFGDDWRAESSRRLLEKVAAMPEFQRARTVALYWSLPGEVLTHDFVRRWAGEKRVLLPVVRSVGGSNEATPVPGVPTADGSNSPSGTANASACGASGCGDGNVPGVPGSGEGVSGSEPEMVFCEYRPESVLAEGAFGIGEPRGEKCSPEEIDFVLVPGVAFDRDGNRMGRGKGFYDRFLSGCGAFKAGICFGYQLADAVPCDAHDIKMDCVVTEP